MGVGAYAIATIRGVKAWIWALPSALRLDLDGSTPRAREGTVERFDPHEGQEEAATQEEGEEDGGGGGLKRHRTQ